VAQIKGLKLTEGEVSQTIDLKELFGVSLSGNGALKNAIAQEIIDVIKERTDAGKSVNGTNLKKPYSKAYSESLDFDVYGKSKSEVNMKLTGTMLDTMDVLSDAGNSVKIGWSGDEQAAKAYNHNTGDTVPKRPFFGINQSELNKIKSKYDSVVKKESGNLQSEKDAIRSAILRRLRGVSFLGIDNGEG
jgi:hypothetical protein